MLSDCSRFQWSARISEMEKERFEYCIRTSKYSLQQSAESDRGGRESVVSYRTS